MQNFKSLSSKFWNFASICWRCLLLGLRAREPRRITTGRAPQRRERVDESQHGARPRDARASTNQSRVLLCRELSQHEVPRSSARFSTQRGTSDWSNRFCDNIWGPKNDSRVSIPYCWGAVSGDSCGGVLWEQHFKICMKKQNFKIWSSNFWNFEFFKNSSLLCSEFCVGQTRKQNSA